LTGLVIPDTVLAENLHFCKEGKMSNTTIQLRERGVFTLPSKIRAKYRLEKGDALTVVDLDGALVLTPKASVVPKLAAEIERLREEAGLSLDDLLAGLPRQRRARGKPRARK
jgi:bifunctional DNA-binding transcriptional regulator/antitoxin component of YhaV-PrlF toxin-antitoxin module